MDYKVVADTLASMAAFVAIVTSMLGWYQSARKPLKVTRVVVHQKDSESKFIIVVRNVKPYPVTIKAVDCYRRKRYQVQKKTGGKPEYDELFPGSEQMFRDQVDCEISANGHTDVIVTANPQTDIPSKLLFLLDTSHGYHELWCKEVTVVEIGQVEVYGVEYKYDYYSKLPARTRYFWKRVVELTRSCSRRLRRG